jgi:hypothetical protein
VPAGFSALVLVLVLGAAFVAPRLLSSGASGPATGEPSAGPAHFAQRGLAFDYPASWHVQKVDLALHYEYVVAYVGNGQGDFKCGADYIPGLGGTCKQTLVLPADSVEMKVSAWDGPPAAAGPVQAVLDGDPKATALMVSGLQSAFREVTGGTDGADLALEWTVPIPGKADGAYKLTAYLKGPDLAASRAALTALVNALAVSGQ